MIILQQKKKRRFRRLAISYTMTDAGDEDGGQIGSSAKYLHVAFPSKEVFIIFGAVFKIEIKLFSVAFFFYVRNFEFNFVSIFRKSNRSVRTDGSLTNPRTTIRNQTSSPKTANQVIINFFTIHFKFKYLPGLIDVVTILIVFQQYLLMNFVIKISCL